MNQSQMNEWMTDEVCKIRETSSVQDTNEDMERANYLVINVNKTWSAYIN